ncbi:MAG: sigma-70 family RNA polymerase sigma factor [Leptolyngbya sp. SIO4C1]|nr:sigma-70 family RNA polymerase sigma factor [Leptolyngbya sp. SIO4C1]
MSLDPSHGWSACSDPELYLALRQGQPELLGVIYNRHAGLVYGIALKMLGNLQEAEDLTQDVFLTLVRSRTYDPHRGSLRTFLAILTRSRAADRLRSRQAARNAMRRLDPQPVTASLPLEQVTQHEQSQAVKAALMRLSTNHQQILQMAYYEGLSQTEMAERLGIPLGTVKSRARQALIRLHQMLTEQGG